MKTSTLILIIIASVLIFVGLLLFAIVMSANAWDFSKISTSEAQVNSYEFEDQITNISIDGNTADVSVLPSDDGKIKVVCNESNNLKHLASIENGTLKIKLVDERKWYNRIFDFTNYKITVYLPPELSPSLDIGISTGDVSIDNSLIFNGINIALTTGSVSCGASSNQGIKITTTTGSVSLFNSTSSFLDLKTTTGNISITNARTANVSIKLTTGTVQLQDLSCKELTSSATTGGAELTRVTATGKFSITRSTGNVSFSSCDAAEIHVETTTGNVTGSLLSNKMFLTDTTTGKVEVPHSTTGGVCDIKTTTGNIKISIVSE